MKVKIRCWDARKCPASQYLICKAYEQDLNCWDVVGKPCCKRDAFERCKACVILHECVELEPGEDGSSKG